MSRPYRILHIDTDRTWRGGQQQVASLLKQLHALGHTNFIASPPGSELLRRLPPGVAQACPVPMRNEWDFVSAWRLARIIRREHPDLLHAHSGRAHTMGILARAFSGMKIPLVVARRVDFAIRKDGIGRWKYANADYYICDSNAIAEAMKAGGVPEDKLCVIYDCVFEERYENADRRPLIEEFQIEPGSVVIGNVAVCEDRKNQRLIVQAAPEVLKQFPQAHFFIVGDGPLRNELIQLSQSLHAAHRVHFPGYRIDIGNFLALFDIFVLVSKMEGLGSSILDAQYFSLPVIATPVGGIPEIVVDGENGIFVPVDDPPSLAKAIMSLIASEEKRKRFGAKGRERILKHHTPGIMTEQTFRIYEQWLKDQ